MAYLEEDEIYTAYKASSDEADQWRADYPQYERLADNGLLEDLDENLPEVNDGTLAASLFKMAKRVIKKKMAGRAAALDRDDTWVTELANIYWAKKILPNATSKASPRRKWKDAARKAGIFGGQPIITLFVDRGNYRGADFIVPYAQDVKLEAGKDSDEDSDIIFWDVYYSKLQLKNMLEEAEAEVQEEAANKKAYQERKAMAEAAKLINPEAPDFDEPPPTSYNKWYVKELKSIIDGLGEDESGGEARPANQAPRAEDIVKKTGAHFFISFQRGKDAPFALHFPSKKKCVRKWSNPDPTGDVPVHYLYYYQDFINPYGIGIVKLAGGTQNVLDYMRQADILATQLGLRPPKKIMGDEDQVDEDSLVYAQDANWYVGNANVERMEMANGVYSQLPGRISMYKTSMNQMIPTGDTSIGAEDSGDPQYSKTPAGVKFQAANLSVDDEDFAENVDECYAAVAKSMINTQFANMQGSDLLKLNSEEREILAKSGIPFPVDPETQEPSNELEVIWDNARATFDFEVDADADKTKDDEAALEGKLRAYELIQAEPNTDAYLAQDSKKLNRGELLSDIFGQLTDNDKIVVDISPEDQEKMDAAAAAGVDPATGQPLAQIDPNTGKPVELTPGQTPPMGAMAPPAGNPAQLPGAAQPGMAGQPGEDPNALTEEEQIAGAHIAEVMEQYQVDENTAAFMLEADRQGYEPEEILVYLKTGKLPEKEPELANA